MYFGLVGRDVGVYIIETIALGAGFTPESKFLLSIHATNNISPERVRLVYLWPMLTFFELTADL